MTAPGQGGVVLAAHGTHSEAGQACIEQLRRALQQRLAEPVRLGWVDVVEPHVGQLLRPGDLVVPAFLGAGYHVKKDLPEAIGQFPGTTMTAHLGPDPLVLAALSEHVEQAGGPWPLTLLGWAGSSDEQSREEARTAARRLAERWQVTVRLTGASRVQAGVQRGRDEGFARVGVASYLLAPGFFADKLATADCEGVAAPIGAHPLVVDLLAQRVTGHRP